MTCLSPPGSTESRLPTTTGDLRLDALVDSIVTARGVARAAAAGVVSGQGSSGLVGASGEARVDSVFDLASLTKPFVAVLAALLHEAGRVDLRTPLGTFLPELAALPAGGESLEAHLSHRAGMAPHVELFRGTEAGLTVRRDELLGRAARAWVRNQSRPVYSDLGYLLVGEGIVRRLGYPLDELLRGWVLEPAGLEKEIGSARQWRARDPSFARRALPTEENPARGRVQAVVHDDNAWCLGGTDTCGHAGLFGTVRGVLAFGCRLLDAHGGRGPWRAVVAWMSAARPGGTLRMGLDGVSGPISLAGRHAEADTFGHLGFTGTSLWCDPRANCATVLLTNRTYPSRRNRRIRAARPSVHDALRALAAAG